MPGPKRVPLTERFWARVVKTQTCWLYGGKEYGNKYAQLLGESGRGGPTVLAHRYSFEIHKGKVPRGKFVCHRCDVRNCVNPDHLYAGDHEDNNQDIIDRGRLSRKRSEIRGVVVVRAGERAGNRKLLAKDRARVVEYYRSGKFTQTALSNAFRVSQGTISAIIRGKPNMGAGGDGKHRAGNYRRKFPLAVLQAIRDEYKAGATQTALAAKYRCHQTYVSIVVRE